MPFDESYIGALIGEDETILKLEDNKDWLAN